MKDWPAASQTTPKFISAKRRPGFVPCTDEECSALGGMKHYHEARRTTPEQRELDAAMRLGPSLTPRTAELLPQLHGWQFQPDLGAPGLYIQCASQQQREIIMRALGWYPGCPDYRSDTPDDLQSA